MMFQDLGVPLRIAIASLGIGIGALCIAVLRPLDISTVQLIVAAAIVGAKQRPWHQP
jgi:hypothetical protein